MNKLIKKTKTDNEGTKTLNQNENRKFENLNNTKITKITLASLTLPVIILEIGSMHT